MNKTFPAKSQKRLDLIPKNKHQKQTPKTNTKNKTKKQNKSIINAHTPATPTCIRHEAREFQNQFYYHQCITESTQYLISISNLV